MPYRYTDVNTRAVYSPTKGTVGEAGKLAQFWLDAAGTVPVDLGLYDPANQTVVGASTGSNRLTVQADCMWPAMWDRAGTQDHVYVQIGTTQTPGALYEIYCDADQRLDSIQAAVSALQPGGAGEAATVIALTAETNARTAGDTAAIATAAADATTKAGSAQTAAISAAATDATSKVAAEAALRVTADTSAIATAAADATSKANAVLASSLQKASNLSDLASAPTARTNLGLGNSATRNIGTTSADVAAGDAPAAGQAAAISAAASDATAKANAAQAAAIAVSAQKSANLSDLASTSTARTNLGLGGAATLAVGTTTGTVAAGDDSRITGAAQKSANLSDLGSASTARTNLGLGNAATRSVGTTSADVAAGDTPAAAQSAAIAAAASDATSKVAAEASARTTADGLLVPLTRTVSTTAPLTGGGDLTLNRTIGISNATTGTVGVVQLTGDLAGTATAPTVPGKISYGYTFIDPRDPAYGAVADGVTDDTAAVLAAFAAANALTRAGVAATLRYPGATVRLSGTFNLASLAGAVPIKCNVINAGAQFIIPAAYAGTAVFVGHATSGSILQSAYIALPDIAKPTGSAIVAGSIGVQVQNLYSSDLVFGRVNYFECGEHFTGLGNGTVYNTINIGALSYCKVSLRLKPLSGGWVNQNSFIGGGIQQSAGFFGGTRLSGYRHLDIDGGGVNGVDGNNFEGVSFEGDVSDNCFNIHQASNNTFNGCRFEAGTAQTPVTVSGSSLTATAHGLAVDDMIIPTYTGSLPGGMAAVTPYYVVTVIDANTFSISRNKGGTPITFSSAGSGVIYARPHRIYIDTSGAGVSNTIIRNPVNPLGWLDMVHSTAIASGNKIETASYHHANLYAPEDLPFYRARNAYSSAPVRPLFATYAPTVNPQESPTSWSTALSDRGVLFAGGRQLEDVSGVLSYDDASGGGLVPVGRQARTALVVDGNGKANYTTLAAALTAIGTSTLETLVITSAITLTANATIPANIRIGFARSGSIALAGFNLTINGRVFADRGQIFSGSGTVTLGSTDEVFPEWWGAKSDGSADAGPAINLAVAAVTPTGGTVSLASGNYKILTTVNLSNIQSHAFAGSQYSVTLKGEGSRRTLLTGGETAYGFIELVGSNYIRVAGMSILPTGTVQYGILAGRTTGDATSGICRFADLYIYGAFSLAGVFAVSDELNVYDDVEVYATAGRGMVLGKDLGGYTVSTKYTPLSTTVPLGGGNGVIRMTCCQIYTTSANATDYPLTLGYVQTFTADNLYIYSENQSAQVYIEKRAHEVTFTSMHQEHGAVEPQGIRFSAQNMAGFQPQYGSISVIGSRVYSVYGENGTQVSGLTWLSTFRGTATWTVDLDTCYGAIIRADGHLTQITEVSNPTIRVRTANGGNDWGAIPSSSISVPDPTQDLIGGRNTVETFTNKRVSPRVTTVTSSATPTPNADTDDVYVLSALAVNATFAAPAGTPTAGQKILLRVKDNGTPQTLAWNAAYRAVVVTLPATTTAGSWLYVGLIWNAIDAVWDVVVAGDDPRIGGAAQKSNNLSDLSSASTARTNLGLGGAATLAVGTTAGTVAAGDDGRIAGAVSRAPKVTSVASSATPTPNADTDDVYLLTALATAATFAAPSGTPASAQRLVIRVKDNGTARAIAWNAAYRGIGLTLPSTTVISKTLYVGAVWNAADSTWDVLAAAQQ